MRKHYFKFVAIVVCSTLFLASVLQAQEPFECADAFDKAEELFNSYLSIKIKSLKSERRLERQVDRKKTAYEWVEAAYKNIINNCGPRRSVASHYRLGCAAENFADFYIEAPLPALLTPEQKDLYKSLLNEKAMPYLDKAKSEFEMALKLAEKEKVRTKYVELSRTKLEEIKGRIKDIREFIEEQKKLEKERMDRVEPERQRRLEQARKARREKIDCAAEFKKAEDLLQEFMAVKFTAFKDVDAAKRERNTAKEAYSKVEKAYSRIMKNCEPEFKVASMYKLGCANENYAEKAMSIPLPVLVNRIERETYRSLFWDKRPYEKEAIRYYRAVVYLAKVEKVKSNYVELSKKKEVESIENRRRFGPYIGPLVKRSDVVPMDTEKDRKLAEARKKMLDEYWEKAKREGKPLPRMKPKVEKLHFVVVPTFLDPSVENKVVLYGMVFGEVEKVEISGVRMEFIKIDEHTLEVTIPPWLGVDLEDIYGPWYVTVRFKDKKRNPNYFYTKIWFVKEKTK